MIHTFYMRYHRTLIKITSAVLLLIVVGGLYHNLFVNTMSNDECLWSQNDPEGNPGIYISQIKPGGVSDAAGLQDGDRLVAVNGIKVENVFHAQDILNKMELGSYAEYTILRNGETLVKKIEVRKLIFSANVSVNLLSLFWLIIAHIVIIANPFGRVQKIMYGIGVVYALCLIPQLLLFFPKLVAFSTPHLILLIVYFYTWSLGVYLFMRLFLIFPPESALNKMKWFRSAHKIVSIALPTISTASFLYTYYTGKVFISDGFPMTLMGLYNIYGYVFGCITLFMSLVKKQNKRMRKPMAFIFITYFFGVLGLFTYNLILPSLGIQMFNSPEYYLPVLLISILPLSIGYAIFRFQLLDVTIVLKRAAFYGATTIGFTALYLFTVYILSQGIGLALDAKNNGYIAAVIFVIIALAVQPVKDRLVQQFSVRFFPDKVKFNHILIRFAEDLNNTYGEDNILSALQETLIQRLRLTSFAVYLKQQDHYHLVRAAGEFTPREEVMRLVSFPIDEHFALLKKNMLFSVIPQTDFSVVLDGKSEVFRSSDVHTIHPLQTGKKQLGFVALGLKESGTLFTEDETELLSTVLNQVSISMENARFYKELAGKAQIEHELSLAWDMQKNLLPLQLPHFPGVEVCGEMLPAQMVGGDYYDMIKVSDHRFLLMVGDVSGKGVPAAFYMTRVQTMLRLFAQKGIDAREILIEINNDLFAFYDRRMFITLALIDVDLEKRTMQICRAGHPPVFIVSGGELKRYSSPGIALGLSDSKVFSKFLQPATITIDQELTVLLYSDGVTEAMTSNHDLFGYERLGQYISSNHQRNAKEICSGLWNEVRSFTGRSELDDDFTVLVAKIK